MDWTDVQVIVPIANLEVAEAIAQMAVPYGIYTEDYSDMIDMVPQIAHIDLIDEELLQKNRDIGVIHLYISPDQIPAEAVSYLTQQLDQEKIEYEVKTEIIKEEDWATAWKDYYHPTQLGNRLVVCPSWESYTKEAGELVMTLDPGMAFGTGTHHTTMLCAKILEEVVTDGNTVLDMGTGSGILSIGALLLGAKNAVGIDIDPVAVRTAKENAEINGFTEPVFRAISADLVSDMSVESKIGTGFDVVVANIVADVIIMLTGAVRKYLRDGGIFVASGIIEQRKDDVIKELSTVGITVISEIEKDGWCALKCQG